jgi:hypothetical protein
LPQGAGGDDCILDPLGLFSISESAKIKAANHIRGNAKPGIPQPGE